MAISLLLAPKRRRLDLEQISLVFPAREANFATDLDPSQVPNKNSPSPHTFCVDDDVGI